MSINKILSKQILVKLHTHYILMCLKSKNKFILCKSSKNIYFKQPYQFKSPANVRNHFDVADADADAGADAVED